MNNHYQVALWYVRHHSSGYALCDSEQDAARLGVAIADSGSAWITGIQFSDGRTIARENWEAYTEARQWMDEAWNRRYTADQAKPPKPVREIRDPFRGKTFTIDASEPSWLGVDAC